MHMQSVDCSTFVYDLFETAAMFLTGIFRLYFHICKWLYTVTLFTSCLKIFFLIDY